MWLATQITTKLFRLRFSFATPLNLCMRILNWPYKVTAASQLMISCEISCLRARSSEFTYGTTWPFGNADEKAVKFMKKRFWNWFARPTCLWCRERFLILEISKSSSIYLNRICGRWCWWIWSHRWCTSVLVSSSLQSQTAATHNSYALLLHSWTGKEVVKVNCRAGH